MSTTGKDFKVKNGIQVSEGGIFGGPISVAAPTDPSHAVTKEYLEQILETYSSALNVDAGDVDGYVFLDAGSPTTTEWETVLDGGNA